MTFDLKLLMRSADVSASVQLFDKGELLECIKKLVDIDQEWVPYSQEASLYIRPTFIGIEVKFSAWIHKVDVSIFLLWCNDLSSFL